MWRILTVRRVQGVSMTPVLRPGQIIVASSFMKSNPGDVVVIRHKGVDKVKRLREKKNGRIYVVGDNATASTDSRSFGWLPLDNIVGKVFWPKV